jgi:hypothetical protein
MRKANVVQLLECDSELAEGLTPEERAVAERALPVPVASLPKGRWRPSSGETEPGRLGYMVVEGLLVRRVEVGQGCSIELLGKGELLRPWQEDTSSFCRSSWEVVEPATLAQLGPGLMSSLSRWPMLATNLLARGIRRSRALAADTAAASIIGLEERLLTAFWQLAETWGETRADGVRLAIRLPHRLLAELMGARRPSVTTALAELRRTGRLDCAPDGYWILRGDPPDWPS